MGGGPSLTDSIAREGLVAVNMWVKLFNFYMTHFTERKPESFKLPNFKLSVYKKYKSLKFNLLVSKK